MLHPIEVKKTATPSLTDSKRFAVLAGLKKDIGAGAVLCFRQNMLPLSRDVLAVPVWEI